MAQHIWPERKKDHDPIITLHADQRRAFLYWLIRSAILNFVAFGRFDKFEGGGQMFALFAIVLAAAGVAVALAIILNVYKHFRTIDPAKIDTLKD